MTATDERRSSSAIPAASVPATDRCGVAKTARLIIAPATAAARRQGAQPPHDNSAAPKATSRGAGASVPSVTRTSRSPGAGHASTTAAGRRPGGPGTAWKKSSPCVTAARSAEASGLRGIASKQQQEPSRTLEPIWLRPNNACLNRGTAIYIL